MRLGDIFPDLATALADLPIAVDAEQVAEMLGLSLWKLYEANRTGELPDGLRPIRIGRRLRWPTAQVLRTLGLIEEVPRRSDDGAAGPLEEVVGPHVLPRLLKLRSEVQRLVPTETVTP